MREHDRLPAARGLQERGDRPCLAHRIVAAEQRRLLTADRAGEVLELQPVRVRVLDLDHLDLAAARQPEPDAPAVPGVLDEDRALRADHLERVPPREIEPAVELGQHVGRVGERPADAEVHPARREHLSCDDALGLASEEARRRDAVAAEVSERPALELRGQAHIARPGVEREPEVRPDHAQLADRTSGNQLLEPSRLRIVAPHERLHAEEPLCLGHVEDGRDGERIRAHRLLAEHVLAGLERADRPLAVQPVRQRDVDRVDRRVGEQRLVAAVGGRDAVLARVRVGPRLVARCHRGHLDLVALGGALDDLPVDASGREQSEAGHCR